MKLQTVMSHYVGIEHESSGRAVRAEPKLHSLNETYAGQWGISIIPALGRQKQEIPASSGANLDPIVSTRSARATEQGPPQNEKEPTNQPTNSKTKTREKGGLNIYQLHSLS